MKTFNHYHVYSLPKGWLVLTDDEIGIIHTNDHAILAWSGHAKDEETALEAAA
jgi:hypothetical protein